MLTEATTQVDAAPRTVMWTISAVAERDGVSKQAVSKRVKGLAAEHGLTVERNARGHIVNINVAEYDHLRGRFGDPSKDQRPAVAAGEGPGPQQQLPLRSAESLDEARRVGAWLENEQRRISLAKERKELVRASAVGEALMEAGGDIARILDRGINASDELAAVAVRDGARGHRIAMKQLMLRMRTEIADALAKVAGEAPQLEPAQSDQVAEQTTEGQSTAAQA